MGDKYVETELKRETELLKTNAKLLQEWIEDVLFNPTGPTIDSAVLQANSVVENLHHIAALRIVNFERKS